MIRIKEKELKAIFDKFKNKSIVIEFKEGIEGKIKIDKANIIFDEKNGYINIINDENKLKINTTTVYRYMASEDYKKIEIRIDSELSLNINLLDKMAI